MDEQETMPAVIQQSPAPIVGTTDTGSSFWDWFLFALTLIGAAIVYLSVFMKSAIGFVVGEAICLGVALVVVAIKYRQKRRIATGRAPKPLKS